MTPSCGPRTQSVLRPRPVDEPALRLFLFHHAGGSHLLFRGWERELPADWDVCMVDAPGHGGLFGAPLIDDAEDLAKFFAAELAPLLDRPFAFFGHSMGAVTASGLARLAAEGGPQPLWLGLSACGPPAPLPVAQRPPGRHTLSDPDLHDWLRSVGATPPEVLDDDRLWRLFGPILRNDFKLVDTWRLTQDSPLLTAPVDVFGGTDDPLAGPAALAAWAGHAAKINGPHLYPGTHFYLTYHQRALTRQITVLVAAHLCAATG